MKRWLFLLTALAMMGVGCSRKPVIVQPPDGSTYYVGSFSCIQVLLQDNDYSDTTIEFYGWQPLQPAVTCQNASNGPAQCCAPYGQTGGYAQGCGQSPCTVTVVARRGDFSDVKFFNVSTQPAAPH